MQMKGEKRKLQLGKLLFLCCSEDEEYADVDWDNLGFSLVRTDYMFATRSCKDGNFEQGYLSRYGNIELNPAAGILNYGQVKLQISSKITKLPAIEHEFSGGFCRD